VSVSGPVVLVGGARSVGRLVGGGRSVGRWRCTVERGRFGKWPELVGGEEQWPANCSGRQTSVVVGSGDGVSFERILKFWNESFLKMGEENGRCVFYTLRNLRFFFFLRKKKKGSDPRPPYRRAPLPLFFRSSQCWPSIPAIPHFPVVLLLAYVYTNSP